MTELMLSVDGNGRICPGCEKKAKYLLGVQRPDGSVYGLCLSCVQLEVYTKLQNAKKKEVTSEKVPQKATQTPNIS